MKNHFEEDQFPDDYVPSAEDYDYAHGSAGYPKSKDVGKATKHVFKVLLEAESMPSKEALGLLSQEILWLADVIDESEEERVRGLAELRDLRDTVASSKKLLEQKTDELQKIDQKSKELALAVKVANKEPLAVLNEVLLELELDVDPIEIAKRVKKLRDQLDVHW